MKARIVINRIKEGYKETLGQGTLYLADMPTFDFSTLERPNLHNQRGISSIPVGEYLGTKIRRSSNNKKAILLHNTNPRTEILIHSGNYYNDSEGCILVGNRFADIDQNGIYEVVNSNDAVNKLFDLIPNNAEIVIIIKKMIV